MVQAVSSRSANAEARVRCDASLCGICGGKIGTGTDFRQALRLSPVSIISPVLQGNSFICHRRCVISTIDSFFK
jgi:hypothetical protein